MRAKAELTWQFFATSIADHLVISSGLRPVYHYMKRATPIGFTLAIRLHRADTTGGAGPRVIDSLLYSANLHSCSTGE
jgi:hypothetical protein